MYVIGTPLLETYGLRRPAIRPLLSSLRALLHTVPLSSEADLTRHFGAVASGDGNHRTLRFEDAKLEIHLRLNFAAQIIIIERIQSL